MSAIREHAIHIVRALRTAGHKSYLCGGCVRDELLGREPADYDVTTDATPAEVTRIFPETYAVGPQYGVELVPPPKDKSEAREVQQVSDSADRTAEHPNVLEVATCR